MNCWVNQTHQKTNLEDFYTPVNNIPPLLICNQNKTERVQKNLLEDSQLLHGETIDGSFIGRNQNDTIYQRNLPSEGLQIDINPRPLSSSFCADPRFLQERTSLEVQNQYVPKKVPKCEETFMPSKGTMKRFQDNIDVDSELRNINQIDTKCAQRLFKVNPLDETNQLSCYSETLVKDYELGERTHGYSWAEYQKCGKLESFEKCKQENVKCPANQGQFQISDNMPPSYNNQNNLNDNQNRGNNNQNVGNNNQNRGNNNQNVGNNNQNVGNNNQNRGNNNQNVGNNNQRNNTLLLQQEQERLQNIKNDMALMLQYQQLVDSEQKNRHHKEFKIRPANITQYKSKGASNIFAPVIRKQDVKQRAYDLGKKQGVAQQVDEKISQHKLDLEKELGLKNCGYNPSHPPVLAPVTEPEIFPFQCREQSKNLYKFNKIVDDSKDCLVCENLFFNQTKRKHLSVGRIPKHLLKQ